MPVDIPTNTLVLIVILAICFAICVWLSFSETLKRMQIDVLIIRRIRYGVAIGLGLFFFVAVFIASNPPDGRLISPGITVAMVFSGILVGVIPLAASNSFRKVVVALPTVWIIAIHILRFGGGYFLTLLDAKLLPVPFAIPGRYGDILVALFSAVLVYLLLTRQSHWRGLIIIWAFLGFLDFASALSTGGLFMQAFAIQRITTGQSVQYLNYVLLIPMYIVPILAVLHIFALYQLWATRDAVSPHNV